MLYNKQTLFIVCTLAVHCQDGTQNSFYWLYGFYLQFLHWLYTVRTECRIYFTGCTTLSGLNLCLYTVRTAMKIYLPVCTLYGLQLQFVHWLYTVRTVCRICFTGCSVYTIRTPFIVCSLAVQCTYYIYNCLRSLFRV